ncbi:Putative undecaprenyl-phosphate sugar phosphotransferase [Propionibacterium freudenreichii]|uniref:sugar transferase n=1 Tax=Propionibacterium freudenreichii TaxID=1744 RepID=UPI0005437E11|nr:sugar transferase [Propionibacterium freudenreichii]CEH02900.1 Putative undecaprenyl-phosphate sugar phosphotransferase [Propionibacterium freudenreichii]
MTTDQLQIDALGRGGPAERGGAHQLRRETREPAWGKAYRRILVSSDFLAIAIAVLVSMALMTPSGQAVIGASGLGLPYVAVAATLGVVWLFALEAGGSRNPWITGAGVEEYMRVIKISLYVFGGIAIASYILKAQFARSLFIALLPIGLLLLLFGRWLARTWLSTSRSHGKNLTSCAVVGPSAQVERVVADLKRHTDAGLKPLGVCLVDNQDEPTVVNGIPSYSASQLLGTASSTTFDAVIATEGLPDQYLRKLAWNLEGSATSLVVTPRVMDIVGPRAHYTDAPGVSLIHVDIPTFSGWKYAVKRAFDIIVSVIALILLSPVFLITAVLIKREDGGPVIFRQQRVGQNGEPFTIHKFRSMSVNAESKIQKLIDEAGGHALFFKLDHDPRMTKIGATLRKYSIDELPQFWTVLKGHMSVVGPRPQMAREVAEYTPAYKRRLLTKPGITGLWQICGRSDLSPDEGMRLDLRYVENWSPISDIIIVAKTITTILKPGNGAY